MIKNNESAYLKYWDLNNLYGWAMLQKFPVNGFKCVEDLSEFDECFIKIFNEKSKKWFFLKVDIQYLQYLHHAQND